MPRAALFTVTSLTDILDTIPSYNVHFTPKHVLPFIHTRASAR